jgi:hypothetical protein
METHRLAAWAEAQRGAPATALAKLEEGLALLDEALPSSPFGAALARLAAEAMHRYADLKKAAGAVELPPLDGRGFTVAGLLEQAAIILAGLDRERAALTDEKLLRLSAGRRPAPIMVRALIRLGEAHGEPGNRHFREAEALITAGNFPHEAAELKAASGRCLLRRFELGRAKDALYLAGEAFRELGDPLGESEVLRPLLEIASLQGPSGALLTIARQQTGLAALLGREEETRWSEASDAFAAAMAGRSSAGSGSARLAALATAARAAGNTDAAGWFSLFAAELALAGGSPEQALAALAPLPEPGQPLPETLLQLADAARAEAHLLQAATQPDNGEWDMLQAETLIDSIRGAEGDSPRMAAATAMLEVMRLAGSGDPDSAVALAASAAAPLVAQGARVALARLHLRLAQGLKARPHPAWREQAEQALALFESAGATPWAREAQRLLERPSTTSYATHVPPPELEPGLSGEKEFSAALLELLERSDPAQPGFLAEFHQQVLLLACRAAGAEYGALYLPDEAGEVRPAAFSATPREIPEVNRWLISNALRQGREEVLEKFQIPQADSPGNSTQSAMCFPLAGAEGTFAALYLGGATERMMFDRAELRRMTPLARQAGSVLALLSALAAVQEERTRLLHTSGDFQRLLQIGSAAAGKETARDILAALVAALPEPHGIRGALLYWTQPERNCLALAAHTLAAPPPDLSAWAELPLEEGGGPAATVLRTGAAARMGTLAGGVDGGAERALLEALGARSAHWVPLGETAHGGGVVVFPSETEPGSEDAPGAKLVEAALGMLAPAILKTRRIEQIEHERDAAIEKLHAAEASVEHLKRYVPHYLRKRSQADGQWPLGEGEELWKPMVAGQIFDLTHLSRLGKSETLLELGAYYGKIGEALSLHHGSLERILGDRWIAEYDQGPENALWGTLTLHQILAAFQEERAAKGSPALRTGIGVHVGLTIGGAVETEQRLEPVLVGEGVQVAARLAEMCRTFRTAILVSDETVQALENVNSFLLRSLGLYRIAPGEKRIGVYELYSARPTEIAETMQARQPEWNAAMRQHRMERWAEAAELFKAYLTHLPQDRPARHFLRECRRQTGS